MEIIFNGVRMSASCKTLDELKIEKNAGPDDVVIVNGFQTGENMLISRGDEIFFIPKGRMPRQAELEAMMAARHTPDVHGRVKNAKVAVAGLGGLGSAISVMLARLGVGEMLLVDYDTVEPSNLNRQQYRVRHLGMKKTEALKSEIIEINPFISIKTADIRVCPDNIKELFGGYGILCEAFDSPEAKAMLINGALEQLEDTVIVAASGMAGYSTSNTIKTERRLKRLYISGDMETEARPGCGLMSPRVMICAGHQANMVLRLIMGIEEA